MNNLQDITQDRLVRPIHPGEVMQQHQKIVRYSIIIARLKLNLKIRLKFFWYRKTHIHKFLI
jgi:hypothetical protein